MIILNAPRGVTRTAGAKAYATKLATSPTITEYNVHNKVRAKELRRLNSKRVSNE